MTTLRWGIVGQRVGGEPPDPARHFYTCAVCGQAVDKRDLAAVFHHEEPGHAPLPPEDATRLDQIADQVAALLAEQSRPRGR